MKLPGSFRTWFAVAGPIAAWMIHLVSVSAWTREACITGTTWVIHADTAAMAAVTLVAMAVSEQLRRTPVPAANRPADNPDRASEGEDAASLVFLGRFGLLMGAVNLTLIVAEGLMAVWLSPCR